MHEETLELSTKEALEKIKRISALQEFYLAGGTALALQLGHRKSADLDFFSEENMPRETLKSELARLGELKIEREDVETIDGFLDGVKISFFFHPHKLLFPLKEFQGIRIADERDIAAMKINAVSGRSSKKDFVDIYFLIKNYSLSKIILFFEKKYSDADYNKLHILKSLVYFEEINDPMPKMIKPADWGEITKFLEEKVKEIKI